MRYLNLQLGFAAAMTCLPVIGDQTVKSMEADYGAELSIAGKLGVGNCMDAAVDGDRLFMIGEGNLYVFDVATTHLAPKPVGRLGGLGSTRQIAVRHGVAYVTSRHDGLFAVDVATPSEPKLIAHYDTIEYATGIAVSDNVAFVTCRGHGIELIDISTPRSPKHLSTIRTGEAQSVVYRDGHIFVGVWGSRELVICDVRDPLSPRIVAKAELDGYGDGLCVKGNYCYIATGHHSRDPDSTKRYGRGHGMEIFDIGDPGKPLFVSRIKTPQYYYMGYDMWDAHVVGNYAFLGDTWNGFFIVNVADPRKPFFAAHKQLPNVEVKGREGTHPAPVGGFALGDGCVYVVSPFSGAYVLSAPGMAKPSVKEPSTQITIPTLKQSDSGKPFRVYKPDGQVYASILVGDSALIAAGSAGLHVVRLWPEIEKVAEYPTDGFCMDVSVSGNFAYVAEGGGGMSVWKIGDNLSLQRVGRYRVDGAMIRRVVVFPTVKYALVQVASYSLHIVNVSDPANPTLALKEEKPGLLSGYPIMERLLDNRYASCYFHVGGFYWYDLNSTSAPRFTGVNNPYRNIGGMAFFNDKCLITHFSGKYLLIGMDEKGPLEKLPHYGIEECNLYGNPSIYGKRLYVSNNVSGNVFFVDVSDFEEPKLLNHFLLDGNPGAVKEHNGSVIIPAGYQGLLVFDDRCLDPAQK